MSIDQISLPPWRLSPEGHADLIRDEQNSAVARLSLGQTFGQSLANGYLIARAPDLYNFVVRFLAMDAADEALVKDAQELVRSVSDGTTYTGRYIERETATFPAYRLQSRGEPEP